jgi:hypothetical protein
MGVVITAFETYYVTADGRHLRYMHFTFPYTGGVVKCIMRSDLFHSKYVEYSEEEQEKINARKEALRIELLEARKAREVNETLAKMGLVPERVPEAVKSI